MTKFQYTSNSGATMSVAVFLKRHLDIRSKSGLEWQALCPFHQDSSPSFSVNIRKGLYICYACGAKGNLKMLAKHFDDNEPISQSASLEEVMEKIQELSAESSGITRPAVGIQYGSRYTDNESVLRYWLDERHLPEELIKTYSLGFDPVDNTAIIPVKDAQGRVVGLIRRTTDPNELAAGYPKYRHPKGMKMSHYLYGVSEAKDNFVKQRVHGNRQRSVLVICEGAVDAISSHNEIAIGFPNENGIPKLGLYLVVSGVAVFGARISHEQANAVKSLAPDYIVIATDQDRAGRLAAIQIQNEISRMKLGVMTYQMLWDASLGKDIAELQPHMRKELLVKALGLQSIGMSGLVIS